MSRISTQPIVSMDLTNEVDNTTIKYDGTPKQLQIKDELSKQFYKKVFEFELDTTLSGANYYVINLPTTMTFDNQKRYLIKFINFQASQPIKQFSLYKTSSSGGSVRLIGSGSDSAADPLYFKGVFQIQTDNIAKTQVVMTSYVIYGFCKEDLSNKLYINLYASGSITSLNFEIYEADL